MYCLLTAISQHVHVWLDVHALCLYVDNQENYFCSFLLVAPPPPVPQVVPGSGSPS